MDSFERKLAALRVKRPPTALEEDIFGRPQGWRGIFTAQFQRPVQLGWAAAFSVLMVISGYTMALGLHASTPAERERVVEIRMVEARATVNDFDFTAPTGEFLSGELSGTTTVQETE